MAAFTRAQRRFACNGVCLNAPQDTCPPGKWPILQNIRSYENLTIQARLGLAAITNGVLAAGVVHSLTRLNDATVYATAPFNRVFGTGTTLRGGQTTYPQLDTGYSGNPLVFVHAQPAQSPRPWLFIADSNKMRKLNTDGTLYNIGIAPPTTETSVGLNPLFAAIISTFAGTPWVASGTPQSSAPTTATRLSTTISQIIYDSGTTGQCSIAPASMANIDEGTIIQFSGDALKHAVQFVTIAVATTTIAQIIYDSGTTGLCTIQPAASLGVGQIDAPDFSDYVVRAGGYAAGMAIPRGQGNVAGTPQVPLAAQPGRKVIPRIRQIDFPVNCLVTLGGLGETVRILSVSLGPDQIQSFRCSTANTHNAGDSITGVAAFRINTTNNHIVGETLTTQVLTNTITPSGTPPAATGGIKTGVGWVPENNPATINGVATLADDDVHLAIKISDCTIVREVRVYLDVDAATNDFTQNYYFYAWRANDIIAAIQAINAQSVATLQSTRGTAVANQGLNTYVPGTGRFGPGSGAAGGGPSGGPGSQGPNTGGQPVTDQAVTSALALGNNQWLELHCKIRDLIRVGTDPSRTLGNIAAANVLLAINGTSSLPAPGGGAITVSYDSLWFSGGRGLDSGVVGPPYVYTYQYRSSKTGARSNPAPASRGGIVARRQGATVVGVQSADPQVDLVDWFRFGGSLTEWTYAGTTQNVATPTFNDVFTDSAIAGGPKLEYTFFQPWATPDLPRTGTCKIAGSAVQQLTGDTFNTNWAPGSLIIINGRTYSLYAQPASTTFLQINENAGSAASATFTIPEATILGRPLPSLWGDVGGMLFACGDSNNPGTLYGSFPNDPDRAVDTWLLVVTSGSEILQNGFVWDGTPYVFSSDQLYTIGIDPNVVPPFRAFVTPCGRGLWTRWAFCWTPDGVAFLAKDGIFLAPGGGGVAIPLTDADLYPLFPHDGTAGVAVNGFNPPDMTQTTRLRLAFINGWLYFDYKDTSGAGRTLAMRWSDRAWFPDLSTPDVQARFSPTGNAVYEELIGGTDGTVYQPSGSSDNASTPIACIARYVDDEGDFRRQKLYRDVMLDGDLTGATVTLAIGFNNNLTAGPAFAVGGSTGRVQYPTGIVPVTGQQGTNLTAHLTWNPVAVGTPLLFGLDLAFQLEPELSPSWLSGFTTHGLAGWQHVLGVFFAYLSTAQVNLSVVIDGVTFNYTLPTTNGLYAKQWVWLQSKKGLTYQWGAQGQAGAAFQVFDQDIEVLVQDWGQPGSYKRVRPF